MYVTPYHYGHGMQDAGPPGSKTQPRAAAVAENFVGRTLTTSVAKLASWMVHFGRELALQSSGIVLYQRN